MTIPARYENGVFRPLQEVTIEEGAVVQVQVPPDRPSVKALAFCGMWADREDIVDGVDYVDTLRNNPRT
jgi:hypothetical protein